MLLDSLLSLVPYGSPLAITNASAASPSTIDLAGNGVGTAPTNIFGTQTLFGMDVGINGEPPQIVVIVGTAFTTGSAATLQVQWECAADLGTPTYQPNTWYVMAETDALTAAQLTAGAYIARFPFTPAWPVNLNPRYLRLNFVLATGTFTAGTIAFAGVTMVRDEPGNRYQSSNFTVA